MPTRLRRQLAAGGTPDARLTAIVAPTGYGKTVQSTLLHEHFAANGANCIWVALDDRAHSAERLLGLLENAVYQGRDELHPMQALIHGDESPQDRIDLLLESMGSLPEPSVLFIDNLNFCEDETLGPLLDLLLFRAPAWIRFVLSSTRPLPVSLSRLRLEGRLREVGIPELSLQEGEVRAIFGTPLCRVLGDEGVASVLEQTEGWPAAVRMAQIILSQASEPRAALAQFSGTDQDIAELLNRQVLAGFDEDERAFLLRLALLRAFNADLTAFSTGDPASGERIERLLERNVFVIALDRNRSWYRLHGLFREFLAGEAHRVLAAAERNEILARAAQWCEQEGRWQDAMDYALTSGSAALSRDILERIAPKYVRDRGDLKQFLDWVERLREGGHEIGLEADYWYVWGLMFHRRYEFARQHSVRLSERVDRAGAEAGEDFRRRLAVIRLCLDTYTDQADSALDGALHWLSARDPADDPFDVATVACVALIYDTANLRFAKAREHLHTARSAIAQADSAYGAGWVAVLGAAAQMQEGDFTAANRELLSAMARARSVLGANSPMFGTLSLTLAKCAVEMGRDDEARDRLQSGLRWAHTHGIVDSAALGLEAAVKLWRGDDADALAELREIAAGYPPRLSMMLSCMLVQRWLRLGKLEDARREAPLAGLRENGLPATESVASLEVARAAELQSAASIDLLIASGQLRHAEERIEVATREARAAGSIARQVELALAEMVVASCSHNAGPAARHLTRAVALAAKRGIVRPFRDRSERIAVLVNDTKPQAWGFALPEERQFFTELCRGLPLTNNALLEELGQSQGEGRLLETPTARELELLGLIEAGLSNQQLADRLSVSVATVKWHLYNLYTKLGVSSRSAALARAKALNLLSR